MGIRNGYAHGQARCFWLWEYFANLLPNRRFLTLLVFLWIFLIMGCIFPLDFFLCTRESGVVFICFIPPTTTPGWSCVFSRTRWSFIFFLTLAPNLCPQSICSLILIPFDFDLRCDFCLRSSLAFYSYFLFSASRGRRLVLLPLYLTFLAC